MAGIAVDVSPLAPPKTGIGYYVHNLLAHIREIDREDEFYLFSRRRFRLDDRVAPADKTFVRCCRIPRYPSPLLWYNLMLPLQVSRHRIDMLYSPTHYTSLVTDVPVVLTVYDLTPLLFPEAHRWDTRVMHKTYLRLSVKKAKVITTISESSKRDIVELLHVPEEKVRIVYPGVERRFAPIPDEDRLRRVAEKYGLPEKFILFVGTLEPRKNLVTLIKAFAGLKKRGIPHRLVVVGKEGWLYDPVFQALRDVGLREEVLFTGYVDEADLPALYNLACVFVMPSLYEGFGLSLLEAMACGCCVVASDCSSVPEAVGDAALLFNPHSVQELEGRILRILEDGGLRKELREKAVVRAGRFNWRRSAEEMLGIFREVAG